MVPGLTRETILAAFERLDAEIGPADPPVDLFVLGGAALVLLFGARESTKDVDAFSPDSARAGPIREMARRVAEELHLPEDWMNDGAKGYVHGVSPGPQVYRGRGLRIRALAPAQLLAMKLCAWRDDVDIEDSRTLLRAMGGDREASWRALAPHLVPGRELKAQLAFDDLWERDHGT